MLSARQRARSLLDRYGRHARELPWRRTRDPYAFRHLSWTAKAKLASAVKEALERFAKQNGDQLPASLEQLRPFLTPPADGLLEGYEIAKPGSVRPPQPNAPESVNAETWAMVEKGNFTSDGVPIRDGSNLADPEYDMYVVIYRGGYYGYGTGKPRPASN